MITREIKVGDRLRWKYRDHKRRREFVVKRIIGDHVWHKDGYFITCFSRPQDFEHVDEPQTSSQKGKRMINREIKVGDRLRWIDPDGIEPSGRFCVARIDGDYVFDNAGKVWFVGEPCRENYSHVDEPPIDPVNHPPHYNAGDIECIDAIRAALGREGFIAYCQGNAIKYLWRHEHKGGVEDWRKADWYINRAIKELGK
jgi:hypothetical protein